MAKHFDAFLYFANWGTHQLMLRVPRGLADVDELHAYTLDPIFFTIQCSDHLILEFNSPEDCREDTWRDWRLEELLPLRADLMAGDLRCAYIAWLAAVNHGYVEDDALEPPVPPGLQSLTGPLTNLVDFLYLDDELLAVAAEASPPLHDETDDTELEAWVTSLPQAKKDDWIVRMLRGENTTLWVEALALFRNARKVPKGDQPEQTRRTAGALRDAGKEKSDRHQQEEAERAARERATGA